MIDLLSRVVLYLTQANRSHFLTIATPGEDDNTDITLLKADLFISVIDVEPIADDLMKRILRCRNNKDSSVAKAVVDPVKSKRSVAQPVNKTLQ